MKNLNAPNLIIRSVAALLLSITFFSCAQKFEPTPDPYGTPDPPPVGTPIPIMSSVTPLKALPGSIVTIKGYNFSTVQSANSVTINGVPAVVNSASISEVLVTVPELPAGTSGKVVLVSGGTTLTGVNNFTVSGGNVTTNATFASAGVKRILIEQSGNLFSITPTSVLYTPLNNPTVEFAGAGNFLHLTDVATYANQTGQIFVSDSLKRIIFKITATGVITPFSGSGTRGYNDGNGSNAQYAAPTALTFDPSGNLFVADEHRVRKINGSGVVTTIAGSATFGDVNATGEAARFGDLTAIVADSLGNVFVADNRYKKIRKISSAGVVTTLAGSGATGFTDGPGVSASFNYISGMAINGAGNIFVSERDPNTSAYRVRMVNKVGAVRTLLSGTSSTTALNGTLTTATVSNPSGLATDPFGNLYIYNAGSKTVSKVTFQ